MENWIFLLLGLVLGIPFNILANFATPWVRSFIKRRNLSIHQRKIQVIVDQYELVKQLKSSDRALIIYLLRQILFGFIYLFMLIAFNGAAILIALLWTGAETVHDVIIVIEVFVILGTGILLSSIFVEAIQNSFRVNYFNAYRELILEKLHLLGATLDEEGEQS